MTRHLFALLALVALFVGCSATPEVPVVDSLNFPATTTKDGAGNFAVTGTVAAHFTGGAITKLVVHVPTQYGVSFADAPVDVTGTASPYTIFLIFPSTIATGKYTFQIIASDKTGTQSVPKDGSVTVQ